MISENAQRGINKKFTIPPFKFPKNYEKPKSIEETLLKMKKKKVREMNKMGKDYAWTYDKYEKSVKEL